MKKKSIKGTVLFKIYAILNKENITIAAFSNKDEAFRCLSGAVYLNKSLYKYDDLRVVEIKGIITKTIHK